MKTNKEISSNKDLLQQFAVKSQKKKVIFGDKAVTYNRCSTDKQDSLGWQEKVTGDYVKQKNWTLIRSFGEKESATTDDRAEFQEMLKFCKKENISHIVFYSYDRFSRTGDTNLLKDLREKGIKVHAATQGADDETPSGRMTQKMYLMFAEMENEQRREKILEGVKNKLRKGEWNIKPTIGYEKRFVTGKKEHDHDKPQCFINEKGKFIKQAFLWKYNENLSHIEISNRLKTMGLELNAYRLTRIFQNPFYCGYITNSLLDNGELIRGKHEPLISEEIFLAVNNIVNRIPHGWKKSGEHAEMYLKASMRCGKCSKFLTAYFKKKYIYYKCPNQGCCVNISNKKLHQLFETELAKFSFDNNLLPVIKNQLDNTYRTLHEQDATREKPMKDELARLKNELEAMEFNHAVGMVSPEIYTKHSAPHQQKIKDIEEELKSFVQETSNLSIYLDLTLQFVQNLLKLWQKHDYNGKVRLQKLVFPEGLVYMPETHAVRTIQVNPIFSAITSISQFFTHDTGTEMSQGNQKLSLLYLMFGSSNFYWENLMKIHNHMNEIQNIYPEIWENITYKILNPVTGATEVVEFNYTSNLTTTIAAHDSINNNLDLGKTNIYNGTTNNSSFIRNCNHTKV